MTINFTIPGNPVPKARARTCRNRHTGKSFSFTPETTRRWEEWVKLCAVEHAPPALLDGPLQVVLTFYLQRPPSIPKRRQHPDRKPDLDNLSKAVLDALQGIIFTTDSRIVRLDLWKHYGDPPRTEIALKEF